MMYIYFPQETVFFKLLQLKILLISNLFLCLSLQTRWTTSNEGFAQKVYTQSKSFLIKVPLGPQENK